MIYGRVTFCVRIHTFDNSFGYTYLEFFTIILCMNVEKPRLNVSDSRNQTIDVVSEINVQMTRTVIGL